MYNILHKYKRFIFLLLKLAIVLAAFYFIFQQLANNELLSFTQLKLQFSVLFSKNVWLLLLLLLFTDANWLLEIFKWKTLVSNEKKITFFKAYEQCFASLTASLITPNRIGEYGAKALYFEKKLRKKIMVLNLIGNLSQLAVTMFFGIFGILFLSFYFEVDMFSFNLLRFFLILSVLLLLYLIGKNFGITKKLTALIRKIINYSKKLPLKIKVKTLAYSLFRYLAFSHQFYFLLRLFNIEANYFTLMSLIFSTYFIASVIPGLTIFDWVIKGSVAVFIFGFIDANPLTIVTITTFMWLLNFAVPALLGSIFVLNFKMVADK
ncbi:MAG: lysylphosphatidylglycerol synthase domain-containing protein [Lutibacter sp.]|nr:lysylphosphatidylglycerol synthase domain-containing protein [Lutibacter sp.]MDT8416683.1 lysylphosphatidylglycerol synthase domain-containing protein [Lutibacter sp.]